MDKKIFIAEIKWIKKEDGGRNLPFPMNENKYSPQISVEGKYIINGSSWSVYCFNFEKIDSNTTKAYIKSLNQEAAPNFLQQNVQFDLYEGPRLVAHGIIVEKCN